MIDAYASWRHFADWCAPVWLALPAEERGTFYGPPEVVTWLHRPGAPHPVDAVVGFPQRTERTPVLVASFGDHHAVRPRPTVLVNHGAGQSYLGDEQAKGHECFSGGPGRERALLHIEPGPMAARASQRAGYRCVETGPAKLDPWHAAAIVTGPGDLVAIGLHHDARGCPEQRTALPHYREELPRIAATLGGQLLGHGHPRSWERTAHMWTQLGVEPVADFATVLDRAAVYVTDSSSTGVEFASLGRPVIFISAPWYRRDVHHHGRFWQWTQHALHVSEPGDLAAAIDHALGHASSTVERQRPIIEDVYVATDGRAAERAAAAILDVL